jgi:perosamine synthetase
MYGVVLDERTGFDANIFAAKLKEKGIETRPFFWGMHEQPVFHNFGLFNGETYPVTERIARQGLYLPSGLTMTLEQIETVCAAVSQTIKEGIRS